MIDRFVAIFFITKFSQLVFVSFGKRIKNSIIEIIKTVLLRKTFLGKFSDFGFHSTRKDDFSLL